MVCGLVCLQRMNTKNTCVQKRSDCVLKNDNHSRLSSQQNWGGGGGAGPFNEHNKLIDFNNE